MGGSLAWLTWDRTRGAPEMSAADHVSPTTFAATTPVPGGAFDETSADDVLVDACLAGHRQAFDVLVRRHSRTVYRVCFRFVGNHEDASDLAQDVFVRAYRGLGRFKREAAMSTWLYRIAVNVCLNRVATKSPELVEIEPDRHVDGRHEPADAAIARGQRAQAVRRAIRQLPRKQRATLVLRMYHELSHEEISRVLGNSVGAVKANFFHALRNLRKIMEDGR